MTSGALPGARRRREIAVMWARPLDSPAAKRHCIIPASLNAQLGEA